MSLFYILLSCLFFISFLLPIANLRCQTTSSHHRSPVHRAVSVSEDLRHLTHFVFFWFLLLNSPLESSRHCLTCVLNNCKCIEMECVSYNFNKWLYRFALVFHISLLSSPPIHLSSSLIKLFPVCAGEWSSSSVANWQVQSARQMKRGDSDLSEVVTARLSVRLPCRLCPGGPSFSATSAPLYFCRVCFSLKASLLSSFFSFVSHWPCSGSIPICLTWNVLTDILIYFPWLVFAACQKVITICSTCPLALLSIVFQQLFILFYLIIIPLRHN